jgi:hypothetical protein
MIAEATTASSPVQLNLAVSVYFMHYYHCTPGVSAGMADSQPLRVAAVLKGSGNGVHGAKLVCMAVYWVSMA